MKNTIIKTELNSENVERVFFDSLINFTEVNLERLSYEYEIVEGTRENYVFNSERLKSHSAEIDDMVSQLSGSGSASLLALNKNKEEQEWGNYSNVEHLIALGVANGNFIYASSKENWINNPGGLPIILRVDKSKEETTINMK